MTKTKKTPGISKRTSGASRKTSGTAEKPSGIPKMILGTAMKTPVTPKKTSGTPKKTSGTYGKRTWQEYWRQQDAWTVRELAFLCCGWNPSTRGIPDPTAFNEALDMVMRAVRVHVLPIIDDLAWPATRYERIHYEIPAFKLSQAIRWAAKKFPDRFPYVVDEKPLDTRERTTLQLIIAALARHAKLDLTEPKTINMVIKELKVIGEARDRKTISTHLEAVSRCWTRSK